MSNHEVHRCEPLSTYHVCFYFVVEKFLRSEREVEGTSDETENCMNTFAVFLAFEETYLKLGYPCVPPTKV